MRKMLLCVLLIAGCGGPPDGAVTLADASCVGCHTDYEALKALHTPDSVLPVASCSGPPPHIEPYDRVFMGGTGFAAFRASPHGQMECTWCHQGVDGTADKAVAHSGAFVARPSFEALDVCAECHQEIVAGFRTGLHFNGWGQKRSQVLRAGVSSFEELPEGIRRGYEESCSTCHASCGSCHVNRPPAAGGGLLNGHAFAPPAMRDNCTACHSSRGGHAYYGQGIGTEPDVHLTGAGFTCLDCHSTDEMHASSGTAYEHRYQVAALPSCTDCHAEVADANRYHTVHMDDLSCHVCHSQDYNTCGSCHVAGEGARIHSHQSFKIGLNPLPDLRPYTFVALRRTLAAPDTWQMYGVDTLEAFDAKPLYNYTSPHNIQRWTSRTRVEEGGRCSDACHRNRALFLFSTDFLQEWERSAAQSVVVDGRLPARWGGM